MSNPPEHAALDYEALAAGLRDSGNFSENQLINEQLCDVRSWRTLDNGEIVARLAADPLAAAAALELTGAARYLNESVPRDADFLKRFTDPSYLAHLVYLGLPSLSDQAIDLPRTVIYRRQSNWDALLFLHLILRWAERFAGWTVGDVRDLTRINLQHPFVTVVVDGNLTAEDALLATVFKRLGVKVVRRDPAVPEHHLTAWLAQLLGICPGETTVKQQLLDFREAGGTLNSLFVVRAMGGVDGYEVRGNLGEDMGLIIDIGDREVSRAATMYLEDYVVNVINEQAGLRAELHDHNIVLRWYNTAMTAEDLGSTIHRLLKEHLVLRTISVNLLFDPIRIASLRASIFAYRDERLKELGRRNEEQEPFILCRSCCSYSPHAFCIVSVDRPPACNRSYDELAALAQFTRSTDQVSIEHGVCQDRTRGRYMGVEKIATHYSRGRFSLINLHSIRDNPHPTTALAQCIAWYLDELDIICVVSSDYTGRSPDGKTYGSLLARVAGRQAPGYLGVSESYLSSSRFAIAEGGMSRVGWMNSMLKERLGIRAEHIATEKDCINMAGLKEYLATWRH